MRIALITDGIWPYVLGGMQKHSYYLCKYLSQKKIHVDLVHFNQSKLDITNLPVFTEEEKKYISSIIVDFPQGARYPGHYIFNSYKHSKLIFEKIKERLPEYDFIYTKGFTGWYLISQKNKGKISCPKIGVNFHGYEMFQKAPDFKIKLQHLFLLRNPVKFLSQKADVVFSYGGKITDIIKSIGVKPINIFELPSGVEFEDVSENINPVSTSLKFLFLGRYERRKGIEELSKVISQISEKKINRKIEFHFIGPIPIHKQLKNNLVFYHGEIRDKLSLKQLIRQCDVLICPSWSEGMPNVILEAMANGLTVIATDVGAINVLVKSKTGYLITNSSISCLRDNIESVINSDIQELNAKKQQSLSLIKNEFIWENLIEKLINYISRPNQQ